MKYLKPDNCVQTIDYYYIGMVTWNHIIPCKKKKKKKKVIVTLSNLIKDDMP